MNAGSAVPEPNTGLSPRRMQLPSAAAGDVDQALLVGIADPLRLALVLCLARLGQATAPRLGELCDASLPTVRRHLETLVTIGIVTQAPGISDGATSGRPASRFSLRREVRERAQRLMETYGETVTPQFSARDCHPTT